MGIGDEIKEEFAEDFKQEAARKIARGIERWRKGQKVRTAQRRWPFELIQNALDVAKERGTSGVKIEITTENDELIFRHNAGYFTSHEIRALVFAYSTKPWDRESELAGRFGTGSLVTHILSKRFELNGILERDESLYYFSTVIDRVSDNLEEISENFSKSFDQLNDAIVIQNPGEEYWTEYIYRIGDEGEREAVSVGVKEVLRCAPFLFSFCDLIELKVDGERLSRNSITDINGEILIGNIGSTRVWVSKTESDEVTIAIPVDISTNEVIELIDTPRIYVKGLPLVETGDYLKIPFTICSDLLETTEDRDSLSNTPKNKDLLRLAFNQYRRVIECLSQYGQQETKKLYHLMDFKLITDYWTSQNELLIPLNDIISDVAVILINEVPLVDTVGGARDVISSVLFPSKSIKRTELNSELFNEFYTLLCIIKNNIPVSAELDPWISTASRLKREFDVESNIQLYGVEDLQDELVRFVRNQDDEEAALSDLAGHFNLPDAKKFLLSFFKIIDQTYINGDIESTRFVDYMIPDQTCTLAAVEGDDYFLSIDLDVPDDIKELMNKIGWEIELDLVHKDFDQFKIVQDLVHRKMDIESALDKAISDYSLQDGFGDNTEQNDKVDGWIEMLRWCALNGKIRKGFSILTKDGKPKQIEDIDDEAFIIPFQAMGIDQELEEIFPEKLIMHSKYFEVDYSPEIVQRLQNKVFVTNLPVYRKAMTLPGHKLESILVEKQQLAKVDHRMEFQEGTIANIPFWSEVVGNISDYQDRARLLFRFCAEYLIDFDRSWQTTGEVICSCGEKKHTIVPSLWLASLKGDSWLPFNITEGEVETIEKRKATKESLENLLSQEEIDTLLTSNPQKVTEFLLHFGFDELDLKVKLQSAASGKSEDIVRKETSRLIDIGNQLPDLFNIADRDMDALITTIEKLKNNLDREPLKAENKLIGENVERILKHFTREQGLEVVPVHKGGDFEFWSESNEGWDGGVVQVGPFLAEVKFTSTTRIHLSTAQSMMAREKSDHYIVLVVENVSGLRDTLKEKIYDEEIPENISNTVINNSRVIQRIDGKLGSIPNPEEVEPDINGYWVKKRLWESTVRISDWLKITFKKDTN